MPPIPETRPSRAPPPPDPRAARKAIEKENPHFNMSEFGMKAGALALLAAVALFPWEKEHEAHERKHHPERFQEEEEKKRERKRGGGGERGKRRYSEGGLEREGGEGRGSVSSGSEAGYLNRDRGYERYWGDDTAGSERRSERQSRRQSRRAVSISGDDNERRRRRRSVEYTERLR